MWKILLVVAMFMIVGCEEQNSLMMIETKTATTNNFTYNITNNFTTNITNNVTVTNNFTIANQSYEASANDYIYNVTWTNGVATYKIASDTDTDTWNTTVQVRDAVNNSGLYNIQINASNVLNLPSGGNSTAEILSAVNNTGLTLLNATTNNCLLFINDNYKVCLEEE